MRANQQPRAQLLLLSHDSRRDVDQLVVVLLEAVAVLADLSAPAQISLQQALSRGGGVAGRVKNQQLLQVPSWRRRSGTCWTSSGGGG